MDARPMPLFGPSPNERAMDDEITPEDVHALLDADEDVCILDIRDERSFGRGHIEGSVNVPFHALTANIDSFEDEDRIVTVCPHGKASVQAARLISSYEGTADARVESMCGGLEEWSESYQLVSEDESSADEAESAEAPDSPF